MKSVIFHSSVKFCNGKTSSVMVIGGLCKTDLAPLLRMSLHRRLMAKQSNDNLLPAVAEGRDSKVRGCRQAGRRGCPLRGAVSGPGTPGTQQLAFLLAPAQLALTVRWRFCLSEVFQKHQIFMVTSEKVHRKQHKPQTRSVV